jgi:hypothetical protein
MENTESSKRKNTTPRSKNKRPRVLAADASWCVDNMDNLTPKAFAIAFKYTNKIYTHSRYKTIIENHLPQPDQSRLLIEFESWRKSFDCTEFWKIQNRVESLSKVDSNCSDAVNNMFVRNSEDLLNSVESTTTAGTPGSTAAETPESTAAETPSAVDTWIHNNTRYSCLCL